MLSTIENKKKNHLFGFIVQTFLHFSWYVSQDEIAILKMFFLPEVR